MQTETEAGHKYNTNQNEIWTWVLHLNVSDRAYELIWLKVHSFCGFNPNQLKVFWVKLSLR